MSDENRTIQELKKKMAQFVSERDWKQYHLPKNLSMAIAIEAAELMEKFQWLNESDLHKATTCNKREIEEELADIFSCLLSFAHFYGIDLSDAFERKMESNIQKYPIEKVKGKGIAAMNLCRKAYEKHKNE